MFLKLKHKKFFLFSTILTIALSNINAQKPTKEMPTLNKIIVSGNKHVKTEVILNKLPYKENEKFDKKKSNVAINNLYSLGYFRQVELSTEKLDDNKINLYVKLEEKKLLERFEFEGNRKIKSSKIIEDLNLAKLISIDEENLQRIAQAIKKMYAAESFHKTQVTPEIVVNPKTPDKAKAIFHIQEGKRSFIKRVFFKGNTHLSDRKLRSIIATREYWLLNFIDSAGEFKDEDLEMDKHRIEYFYKDIGYLMATVAKADVEYSKDDKNILITFYIKEGEQFILRKVSTAGDDLFKEEELLHHITMEVDKPYCQSKLIDSINNLKNLWGEKGYIYADVYPQIKTDEKTNEVEVTFYIEKGKQLFANRINITGNRVTRDNVIRRELEISEGDLITSEKLDASKNNVEYLSYFEKGGVNWRIHRISDDKADLEMNIKEAKTGNFQAGLSYGSDKFNPKPSLRGNINIEKKNLFGMGWDANGLIQGNRHILQRCEAGFFNPNIFDWDISMALHGYLRWEEYDQWHNLNHEPKENIKGATARFGIPLPSIDRRLQFLVETGIENITNNHPKVKHEGPQTPILQNIIDRRFQEGTLLWASADLLKDTRNHKVYPNKGYKFLLSAKTAPPFANKEYSFLKVEGEVSWYTPLIGEDSLVLLLHGWAGTINSIGGTNYKSHRDDDTDKHRSKVIPYKELYHMGGQTTVRGFVWGSIGPALLNDSPLGARHAIQFNAELIFPLIQDYSMKGHFFYDAGAGWDTPKEGLKESMIKRNKFNLRHSVGFGLNLLKPVPAKVDWGYKLDRDKKAGESPSEFHLSMNYAW